MKKITITVNGKEYPCRNTLGAMLRFQRMTGKEATEVNTSSISELAAYIFCCTQSECKNEGVPFDMSFDDFTDAISMDELNEWAAANTAANEETDANGAADGEKKS